MNFSSIGTISTNYDKECMLRTFGHYSRPNMIVTTQGMFKSMIGFGLHDASLLEHFTFCCII